MAPLNARLRPLHAERAIVAEGRDGASATDGLCSIATQARGYLSPGHFLVAALTKDNVARVGSSRHRISPAVFSNPWRPTITESNPTGPLTQVPWLVH